MNDKDGQPSPEDQMALDYCGSRWGESFRAGWRRSEGFYAKWVGPGKTVRVVADSIPEACDELAATLARLGYDAGPESTQNQHKK